MDSIAQIHFSWNGLKTENGTWKMFKLVTFIMKKHPSILSIDLHITPLTYMAVLKIKLIIKQIRTVSSL